MSYLEETKAASERFFRQKSRDYLYFQLAFGALAFHALVSGLAYLFSPESALEPFLWLGVKLGGREYLVAEQSHFWRVLAGVDVLTLAFLCVLLQVDVKRHWLAVYILVFMKAVTAAAFLGVHVFANSYPAFWGMAVWNALVCAAFLFFAIRARMAAEADETVLVPRPLGCRPE